MDNNHSSRCNQKHLTLSNRIFIEQELYQGHSFSSIARTLGKDPSTISKEVKKHRIKVVARYHRGKCRDCKFFRTCTVRGQDVEITDCPHHYTCHGACHYCTRIPVYKYCKTYIPFTCGRLTTAPYVCNSCPNTSNCIIDHYSYNAVNAQRSYEKTLTQSREGINLTQDELESLNELISPLILKGQPLSHIFAVHSDEIPVCRRTLYNYLDQKVFQARNIDLPRRVRYKKRKNRAEQRKIQTSAAYRNKRTYVDFEKYMQAHPDFDAVEMDTVKGSRTKGKCLLTLLFRSCSFMLIILMPECTQAAVAKALNDLTEAIGLRCFKKHFPVILTDNGPEFKDPSSIEYTPDGKFRTYVFYCDPYVSNQKGRLEKNHEYIRYVIPKGRSMQQYTQKDISLLASHINSTARDSLNGATPFELARILLDDKIPAVTGQYQISPDDIVLKPALLSHKD